MLITDLNLAEGRNSITGSQPSDCSFSSSKSKALPNKKKFGCLLEFSVLGLHPHTPNFILFFLIQAIVELAADTRKMVFRYSRLCGKASDAVGAVRSAIPTGFEFFRIAYGNIELNKHNLSSKKI
jgi:hypothetical protein